MIPRGLMMFHENNYVRTSIKPYEGEEIEQTNAVNAPLESLRIFGNEKQEATYYQKEGYCYQEVADESVNKYEGTESYTLTGASLSVTLSTKTYPAGYKFHYRYTPTEDSPEPQGSSLFSIKYVDGTTLYLAATVDVPVVFEKDVNKIILVNWDYLKGELDNFQVFDGALTEVPTYTPYSPAKPSPDCESPIEHVVGERKQLILPDGIYETVEAIPNMYAIDGASDKFYVDTTSVANTLKATIRKTFNSITFDGSDDEGWTKTINTNIAQFEAYNILNIKSACKLLDTNTISCTRYKQGYNDTGSKINSLSKIMAWKSNVRLTYSSNVDTTLEEFKQDLTTIPMQLVYKIQPTYQSINLTKVESSTLPILDWTAYGSNSFNITVLKNSLVGRFTVNTYLSNGFNLKLKETSTITYAYAWQQDNQITLKPNTDYTLSFDYKIISGGTWGRVILAKNLFGTGAVQRLSEIFCRDGNGRYSGTFNSGNFTKAYLFMNMNSEDTTVPCEKEYTNFMLTGGSTALPYEPFNPTPPESLTVSPDYPQQCYFAKDFDVKVSNLDTSNLKIANVDFELGRMEVDEATYNLVSDDYGKHIIDGKYYVGDFIELIDGQVKYNECITNKDMTSDMPWSKSTAVDFPVYYCHKADVNMLQIRCNKICTHFKSFVAGYRTADNTIPPTGIGLYENYYTANLVVFNVEDIATLDDWKSYLDLQVALGTPINVEYIMATPVVTDITNTDLGQAILAMKSIQNYTRIYSDNVPDDLKPYIKADIRVLGN